MTPSSLIFFVIITVWAVYVVQHWIRRRDHVATARSVDRFSEAMRVLERRRVLPQMNVAAPQRQSYAVGLSRPAHPDVVVKRAQPRLTVVGDAATTAGPTVNTGPTANTGPTPAAPPTRSSAAAPQRRGATSTRRTVTASAPLLTPARTRALALVIGAVLLVAGIALAVTGTWWAAPAGVAAFGAALGYVRFSVARARRRSTSPVRHPSRRPQVTPRPERRRAQAAPAATRRPVRRASGAARLTGAPVAAARVRGSAPIYQAAPVAAQATVTVAAAPSRTRDALYDVEAVEASVPAADLDPRQEAPAAQLEPGTWQPVPVPPPTYTLKARAPRARDRAAADTPVEDLPFDGNALALDEEFEDLPAVHHVG